jgi:LysR family nod box-dependent transcriptional activator
MNPSKPRNLRTVNLNLLPVLAELLACKNVTHAAARVYLTQSAVSASLKRLREIFDDELLVMRGREMVLTEKAEKLLPSIRNVLDQIGALVNEERFDPATSTQRFRIVTADYVSAILISDLGRILQESAPGISLHASQGAGGTVNELQLGFVDLLIAPESLNPWEPFRLNDPGSDFQHEVCLHDHLVAIESAHNPPRTEPISVDEYLSRPHASFHLYPNTPASVEHDTLARLGLSQNDKFIVPYFTLLPNLVVSVADAIALVPATLAVEYAKLFPIRTFRPPIDFPSHDLIMVWARSRERDPELCWLRQVIRQSARRVAEGLAEVRLSAPPRA